MAKVGSLPPGTNMHPLLKRSKSVSNHVASRPAPWRLVAVVIEQRPLLFGIQLAFTPPIFSCPVDRLRPTGSVRLVKVPAEPLAVWDSTHDASGRLIADRSKSEEATEYFKV